MNFLCNFIFTSLVFRAVFSNKKKKKFLKKWFLHFENESMENESTAFITLLHEPIVNCESRENHLRPWRKKRERERKKM